MSNVLRSIRRQHPVHGVIAERKRFLKYRRQMENLPRRTKLAIALVRNPLGRAALATYYWLTTPARWALGWTLGWLAFIRDMVTGGKVYEPNQRTSAPDTKRRATRNRPTREKRKLRKKNRSKGRRR